jgi:multiple sugar transport system permease protein
MSSISVGNRARDLAGKVLWYAIIILIAFPFVFPFIWMVLTAFKMPEQIVEYPPKLFPNPWTLRGFAEGLDAGQFSVYLKNTLIVTLSCVVGSIMSSLLVGFGFARLEGRFKNKIFIILLGTMMIPGTVTLIPAYVIYSKLGWIDTYIPLILPSFLGGSAFFIFLVRQFLINIPKEIEEAAKIDGCSLAGILFRIFLPISLPVIIIIGLFTFVSAWNDFFGPMIFLNDSAKFTLAVGLNFLKNQYGNTDMGPLMAMSLMSILPVLVLFFMGQKYFIQGITTTGIK